MSTLKSVRTEVLDIAFLGDGPPTGWSVVLAHGCPYDIHAYEEVAPRLAEAGARVIRPYLRGFGPTRSLSIDTIRSGQQAALGRDLVDLLDAPGIQRAVLAGYDWGGLSSCVVSALWPKRVAGLADAILTVREWTAKWVALSYAKRSPFADGKSRLRTSPIGGLGRETG